MNTVVVCDTEPIAMEGLRGLLDSLEGLRVVAAESSLEAGSVAAAQLQPTLVVVDKAFGISAVMDWVRTLRAARSHLPIVVWSASFSEAEALRFLQAGAVGVVRKTVPLSELLACLRVVMAGGTWMESEIVPNAAGPARIQGRSALTAREQQVMELIERGYKNKEIAVELGIRTGTVKIHLKHIFEKTGIRGRYGLAISGLKEKGLLDMSAA